MTNKQIIIDDQKKTIHRLQDECTEKTNAIIALGEQFKRAEKTVEERHKYQAELEDKLEAKEQECEELKKIINEAKNSKLDLKSFLVGEAVQNEYEQQLDQLKADREEALKQLEFVRTLNTVREAEIRKLTKTLTEIKEIAEKQIPYLDIDKSKTMIEAEYDYVGKIYNLEQRMYTILQKISEVEDGV